jgi:hypothetical protein
MQNIVPVVVVIVIAVAAVVAVGVVVAVVANFFIYTALHQKPISQYTAKEHVRRVPFL